MTATCIYTSTDSDFEDPSSRIRQQQQQPWLMSFSVTQTPPPPFTPPTRCLDRAGWTTYNMVEEEKETPNYKQRTSSYYAMQFFFFNMHTLCYHHHGHTYTARPAARKKCALPLFSLFISRSISLSPSLRFKKENQTRTG